MEKGTIRQRILEIIANQPSTALELSGMVGIPEKEVAGHLEHIEKSLYQAGGRLLVTPSCCKDCGYEFKDRKKKTKPGKCPKCRSTFLEKPLFSARLPKMKELGQDY